MRVFHWGFPQQMALAALMVLSLINVVVSIVVFLEVR